MSLGYNTIYETYRKRQVCAQKTIDLFLLFSLILLCPSGDGFCQENVFFREYWAEFDENVSNHGGGRWRVNDEDLNLHEEYGKRPEARANGLVLVNVPEDLFLLDGAEIYLELWGGHPLTANKRFFVNGKQLYAVPGYGTEENNCTYSYPAIPVEVKHLVNGINAFQFACDRGSGFWGHFIMDNLAVKCYLKADHPVLAESGLKDFFAEVVVPDDGVLNDRIQVSLSYPKTFESDIGSVDYYGRYLGFDDNGNGLEDDWHGFTFDREAVNHIGTSTKPPFAVDWDTSMIPDQDKPMAVKALIHFKNGVQYRSPVTDGLTFPKNRKSVRLYSCSSLPKPFWSRASQKKTAIIRLPQNLSGLEKARLYVKIWDGGEGTVKEPFTINGHPYNVVSGKHIHDVVFTIIDISPEHLKPGDNELSVLSDTEHHGIEVLLPGPCMVIRYK
ncbi:MAG: hypothetical protein JXB48_00885 [Candidatus Latescibacteria bacterium]|nr:hypothetical protein [Candidatus Latescibacterota bacterium]